MRGFKSKGLRLWGIRLKGAGSMDQRTGGLKGLVFLRIKIFSELWGFGHWPIEGLGDLRNGELGDLDIVELRNLFTTRLGYRGFRELW